MNYRISIDTGGTFTDVVVTDDSGRYVLGKALTDHSRVFNGIRGALKVAAEQMGLTTDLLLSHTELFIYGTTRATNAIVEQKVAKTAMLVTKGFPDILTFREGGKARPHDFSRPFPQPFIPRRHTFEINERIDAEGGVVKALDDVELSKIVSIIDERKFEAVSVCLLWSTVNPVHELAIGEALANNLPNLPFTLSHQLLPIIREYRRASATAIDASLKPLMQSHLSQLEADLRNAGYNGRILVSTSMGGCLSIEEILATPIHTTKSGPAMAPVAARDVCAVEGPIGDVIICDTGGTTFDVALVRDGEIVFTRETWIGERWSGHLVATSTVDVRSLGAGGGSIAWVDNGGMLRVGPQSAGSEPGPACYGRGGTLPTVTDAAVVLGYLHPDTFLGGRMRLDAAAAKEVIGQLATQIGNDVLQTAWAVLRIASELMIKSIQEICLTEGINPREATLVAGGGAAGLNVLPIAAELGVPKLMLPKTASALSASGMQRSDIVREEATSFITRSSQFDRDGVQQRLKDLEFKLRHFIAELAEEGLESSEMKFTVEARYRYQVWELDVPLTQTDMSQPGAVTELVETFHRVHDRVLGIQDLDSEVEFLNWKGRATIRLARPLQPKGSELPHVAQATRIREAFFDNRLCNVPVFDGQQLQSGAAFAGPAIVEEPTTTLIVHPGWNVRLSGGGTYVCTPITSAQGEGQIWENEHAK